LAAVGLVDFGDYLVFVDESGDHGLQRIDPQFPIFALVFVLIKKVDYIQKIIPAFQGFKMKYWGHGQVILHEHDLRKGQKEFGFLRTDSILRKNFMEDLTTLIKEAPFQYLASVIYKDKLSSRYASPYNPYEIGLFFCMERLVNVLANRGQNGKLTHILIEARGLREDTKLKREFYRIKDNKARWGYKQTDFTKIPLDMLCVDKKSNSTGLQLTDLIVRPIALERMRPSQANRTYDILREKCLDIKGFP
jgi:hypothetical protein